MDWNSLIHHWVVASLHQQFPQQGEGLMIMILGFIFPINQWLLYKKWSTVSIHYSGYRTKSDFCQGCCSSGASDDIFAIS